MKLKHPFELKQLWRDNLPFDATYNPFIKSPFYVRDLFLFLVIFYFLNIPVTIHSALQSLRWNLSVIVTCRVMSNHINWEVGSVWWFSSGGVPLPFPLLAVVWEACLCSPWPADRTPLGQTVPCLLIPPANRNAFSQRSPGCSGQAEMPNCLGVSPPR